MTVATWVLAISTAVLAIEGATALRGWFAHLGLTSRRREIEEIKRQLELLQHAAWMDVATAGQGTRPEVDEKVRRMLQMDGWTPDGSLMEQAGYFDLSRLQDDIPGFT